MLIGQQLVLQIQKFPLLHSFNFMSDFKTGGVPTPDYDSENVFNVYKKAEFSQDIFVYGDAYASSFNNVEISVVGSTLTFTVAGIGSTSLTLS